jgi:replicative DNA helicase
MSAVAARSSIGKTVIAGNIARNVAMKQGGPTAFFSLEMGAGDLIQRAASAELAIPYNDIRENNLTPEQREKIYRFAETESENRNFRIEHVPSATAGELYLLGRKAVRDMGAKLIVVDYAQSIESDRGVDDPGVKMTEAVSRMAEMAGKLTVHVLLLAQLKKPQQGREEEAPTNVNDILYGTKIENAATTIMMLHRRYEEGKPGSEAEVHTVKNRHGSVGVDELIFDGMRQRFLPPGVRMTGAW